MINKSCITSLSGSPVTPSACVCTALWPGVTPPCGPSSLHSLQMPDCCHSSGRESQRRESEKIGDDDREKVHPGPNACLCMPLPGSMAGCACVCLCVRARVCVHAATAVTQPHFGGGEGDKETECEERGEDIAAAGRWDRGRRGR